MATENKPQYGFDTLALHAGQSPDSDTGSRAVPIYQTTSYVFDSPQHAAELFALQTLGNIYTRIMNPTNAVLEERVAALEGGLGALALSSGQSALLLIVLSLAQAGDHVVSERSLYGGSYTALDVSIRRLGIEVSFVDTADFEEVKKAIRPNTKFIFSETISNPRCKILDIEKLASIAHEHDVPLVVDNTLATPYLCRPLEFGADIVYHSLTKFLGGHGTSIGGIIVDGGSFPFDNGKFPLLTDPSPGYHGMKFWENFREYALLFRARAELLRDLGPALSPFNAFLFLQGIETLSLRMQRHIENTQEVAKFLKEHPVVEWVDYPIFFNDENAARSKRYLPKGAGSVFTFGIKGGIAEGRAVIEHVELLSHLANVGDAKTLIIHPASTTHSQLEKETLKTTGIAENLIRLSVGLEDVRDIIADLDQALKKSQKG